MKRIGNVASNRIYNPQNTRPPVPFDVDEADSAMERFIRQKYQEKAMKAATRHDTGSSTSDDHPPPLPPKTGSRFGFRSTSSIFPLSSKAKREAAAAAAAARPDPRDRSPSPPRWNKPSKLFGTDVGSPTSDDIERKMARLRNMGFKDERRNLAVLKGLNGNFDKSIETLVRLGEGPGSAGLVKPGNNSDPSSRARTPTTPTVGITINRTQEKKSPPAPSTNPFDMLDLPPRPALPQSSQSTGSLTQSQNQTMASNPYQQSQNSNPFGRTMTPSQSQYNLNQAFQNMAVSSSQPLFPHHTGGFPGQQQQNQQLYQQPMTPPVPSIPQQYFPSAPVIYENPSQQPQQNYNPFMQQQQQQQQQRRPPPPLNTNVQSNPYTQQQGPFSAPLGNYQLNPYGQQQQTPQAASANPNFQSNPYAQQQQQPQQAQNLVQPPVNQPSAFYGNTPLQSTPLQSPQQQNPFLQNNPQQQMQQAQQAQQVQQQFDYQAQQQNLYQQQFRGQVNPLMPQQTGRADKRSILDLYNYPQLAPTPLQQQQQQQQQGQIQSAQSAPALDMEQQQRSVSTPVTTSMANSRNPFASSGGGGAPSSGGDTVGAMGQFAQTGAKNISRDSMLINAGDWQNGRHSPDAWGTISGRSMR
jgi:hypothetical protein